MRTSSRLILGTSLVGIVSLLPSTPVTADHVSGATYRGTVDGGGTVEFTVAADGSAIPSFLIDGVAGDTCTFNDVEKTNVAINDHAFDASGGGVDVAGSFTAGGNASGTLRLSLGPPIACDTGTVDWTASTDGGGDDPGGDDPGGDDPGGDDEKPTLRIKNVKKNEGTPNITALGRAGHKFKFPVKLSEASDKKVVVKYKTIEKSAKAGKDYKHKEGKLVFKPGVVKQKVKVKVFKDSKVEPNEKFLVKLRKPRRATFADRKAKGIIKNDD